MRRDLDLIRTILIYMEEAEQWEFDTNEMFLALDIERDVGRYHLKLLDDAGLTAPIDLRYPGAAIRLTFQGHEFIANLRNDTVWARTRDFAKKHIGSISLGQLVKIAEEISSGRLAQVIDNLLS